MSVLKKIPSGLRVALLSSFATIVDHATAAIAEAISRELQHSMTLPVKPSGRRKGKDNSSTSRSSSTTLVTGDTSSKASPSGSTEQVLGLSVLVDGQASPSQSDDGSGLAI